MMTKAWPLLRKALWIKLFKKASVPFQDLAALANNKQLNKKRLKNKLN